MNKNAPADNSRGIFVSGLLQLWLAGRGCLLFHCLGINGGAGYGRAYGSGSGEDGADWDQGGKNRATGEEGRADGSQ